MSYDVFISYASKDKTAADAVCARLEAAGIRCWIAPRDITPGTSYGEAIIEAIHGLKVMVLVFSSNANLSAHIPKEVERAVSSGVTIIPFRIEDVAPGKSLDYFIGSVHWLDAMTPPLEKHLDALAATVRKLLPAKQGEPGAPAAPTPGVWQPSAAPAAPTTAAPAPPPTSPAATPRPATSEPPRAKSSNTIWIGVAAVAVIAVVVLGVMLMRGGGGGGGGTQTVVNVPNTPSPAATNPSSSPNPVNKPVAENALPKAPIVNSSADPIVGCYQWFNNGQVVIHENGTMVGGPFTARWRVVNAAQRSYTFTWPEAVDTITLSPNQQSLSGGNQYGYPTSATRLAGSTGLTGSWTWPNGAMVIVSDDGTFNVFGSTMGGKWKTVDASRRTYTLTWPDPVDSVTLSADGSRVFGSNQYGIAISGVRTQPCSEN